MLDDEKHNGSDLRSRILAKIKADAESKGDATDVEKRDTAEPADIESKSDEAARRSVKPNEPLSQDFERNLARTAPAVMTDSFFKSEIKRQAKRDVTQESILAELGKLSDGQEKLSDGQEKLARRSNQQYWQNWAIIGGTIIIIFLTAASFAVGLHWP